MKSSSKNGAGEKVIKEWGRGKDHQGRGQGKEEKVTKEWSKVKRL